jgi:hypothetical protein
MSCRKVLILQNFSATFLLCLGAPAAFGGPWPGDSGTEIGNVGQPGGLPVGSEPSGAAWQPRLEVLLVVGDEGRVSRLDADGQNVTTWAPGVGNEDLEAVAVGDPDSDLVYLGREHPDAVLEFDLSSGFITDIWDLTPWMTGPDTEGLEALTYAHGLFYAGHQGEGNVYVFRLLSGAVVEFVDVFAVPFGRDDLSGLHYDKSTETLYAIHDNVDVIVEMKLDGSFLREFDLPGSKQEGVAVVPDCAAGQARVFVSEDSEKVWRYELYPAVCVTPIPSLGQPGALLLVVSLVLAGWAKLDR